MGAVGDYLGYDYLIDTSQIPSEVLIISFSKGFFSDLKMVESFFKKVWNNHNCTVIIFRGGWRSLDLYMRGLLWLMMITLGEVDGQKVLVE